MGLGWGYMIVYGSGWEWGGDNQSIGSHHRQSSIKSAAMLSQDVGFDGENWFMDANDFWASIPGLVVTRVFVTAANVEREGGKRVLKRVNQMGKAVSSAHDLGRWWVWRWAIHAVGDGRLPLDCSGGADQSKPKVVLLKTLGSRAHFRLDDEHSAIGETIATSRNIGDIYYLATIRIMIRRLA